jgi:hypothetical protein
LELYQCQNAVVASSLILALPITVPSIFFPPFSRGPKDVQDNISGTKWSNAAPKLSMAHLTTSQTIESGSISDVLMHSRISQICTFYETRVDLCNYAAESAANEWLATKRARDCS